MDSNIHYVVGDATVPQVAGGLRIIAHICNNQGGWGAGFVLALSKKWKEPEARYRAWNDDGLLCLGDIQLVPVSDSHGKIYVANMVAQNGYGSPQKSRAVDYGALSSCFNRLQRWAGSYCDLQMLIRHPHYNGSQISIHMPRIGCGLGGGDWSVIEELIQGTLGLYDVYVYDLE